MTITIKINTDNAAFEGDRDEEIARMLRRWLERGISDAGLMDLNGNRVGSVQVKGK